MINPFRLAEQGANLLLSYEHGREADAIHDLITEYYERKAEIDGLRIQLARTMDVRDDAERELLQVTEIILSALDQADDATPREAARDLVSTLAKVVNQRDAAIRDCNYAQQLASARAERLRDEKEANHDLRSQLETKSGSDLEVRSELRFVYEKVLRKMPYEELMTKLSLTYAEFTDWSDKLNKLTGESVRPAPSPR